MVRVVRPPAWLAGQGLPDPHDPVVTANGILVPSGVSSWYHLVSRDERESRVDNRGDRLAYLVLSFDLLAIVAYRSFAGGMASWDLLGLVVLGGLVGTLYRLAQRAVSRDWTIVAIGTAAVALVVAAIVIFATR